MADAGAGAQTFGSVLARRFSAPAAPLRWLALAVLIAVAVLGGVLSFAVSQPWLGLDLRYSETAGGAVVHAAQGPSRAIPVGTAIRTVAGGRDALQLERLDLTDQVDGAFHRFADFQRFMNRQGRFAAMQRGKDLVLVDTAGRRWTIHPRDSRPIASLGVELWIGLLVGVVSWLTAAAIAAFRPHDISARYVLLSGAAMLACAPIGPLYTSRELALPTTAFYLINGCNFLGGSMFAAAIFVTLLHFPRRLAPDWVGWSVIGLFIGWYAAQACGLFPDLTFARRFLVMCALFGACILSAVHWRLTRRAPIARAALGWFVLSWVVVVLAFALLILAPQLFGVDTSAAEPFAFLLFLLVYAGLAVGIMRYRLFELGVWWARIVTWVLGLALLALLDVGLLTGLQLSAGVSLAMALLICGLLWLPVRTWVADRLLKRHRSDPRAIFESVIQVGLAADESERIQRWTALLKKRFEPLIVEQAAPTSDARLEQDGLALITPALPGISSLRLQYPRNGGALFAPADLTQVRDLAGLVRLVVESRDAYQRGVAKERRRIAGDVHDNLGATLLDALHSGDPARKDALIRDGLQDLRRIITDLAIVGRPPAEVLLLARREMADRLRAHGMALEWTSAPDPFTPPPDLAETIHAILRELTTNAIKHSEATGVRVDLSNQADHLTLTVEDNGVGFDPTTPTAGQGLTSLAERVEQKGGVLTWTRGADGHGAKALVEFPFNK